MSVYIEGSLVYLANGNLQAYPLTRGGNAFSISETRQRYCARPNNPDISSQLMNVSSVAVSPDDSDIVYIGSAYNFGIQKLQVSDTGCTVLTHIGKGVRSYDKNGGDDVTTIAAIDVLGLPFYALPMWSQIRHDLKLAPLSWFGNMPITSIKWSTAGDAYVRDPDGSKVVVMGKSGNAPLRTQAGVYLSLIHI